ncbi:unnamed protein product [Somion occarium]
MATTAVLSPTIPAPPVYTPIEKYPSSPILSFPPPMPPSTSRSLRERCGVNLRVSINSNNGILAGGPWSPKIHVQPHRSNLPRRRKVTKRFALKNVDDDEVTNEKEKEVIIDLTAETSAEPTVVEPEVQSQESHIQELIPGLYIAFSDGDPNATQPGATDVKPYTHVVNISYPPITEEGHPGSCEKTLIGRTQNLHIILPASSRPDGAQRPGLGLTDSHLRSIRDFIGEALPYAMASQPDQSAIRVLITTPPGRPTDAMCAAGCYLAFTSGKGVETVLRYVDEEEDFLSIWKGEVSGDELDRTEKIARAWSWLSQVPAHQT